MIIAVIKLHGTDPTGDEEEGKMARSTVYSFSPVEALGTRSSMWSPRTLTNYVITFM